MLGVASLAVLALLSAVFPSRGVADALLAAGLLIVPLSIGVAVVRHRLFDT